MDGKGKEKENDDSREIHKLSLWSMDCKMYSAPPHDYRQLLDILVRPCSIPDFGP